MSGSKEPSLQLQYSSYTTLKEEFILSNPFVEDSSIFGTCIVLSLAQLRIILLEMSWKVCSIDMQAGSVERQGGDFLVF